MSWSFLIDFFSDPKATSTFIVGVFVVLLFFVHIIKKTSYKKIQSIPISLGIFFTFIGVSLALQAFNTEKIDESIPVLLEGLKVAFYSSVVGILCSLIISLIISFTKDKEDEKSEKEILNKISESLDNLNKIFNSSEEGSIIGQLKLIRTDNSDSRKELGKHFSEIKDSLQEAIQTLSKGATEQIIKALEDVIKDFNSNLTDQFGDNFKKLNESVFRLISWQEQYKENIINSTNHLTSIQELMNDSSKSLDVISSKNKEVLEVYNSLGDIINTYKNQAQEVKKQLEVYKEIPNFLVKINSEFEKSTKNSDELVKNFDKVYKTSMEKFNSFSTKLSEDIPKLQRDLDNNLGSIVSGFRDRFIKIIEEVESILKKPGR